MFSFVPARGARPAPSHQSKTNNHQHTYSGCCWFCFGGVVRGRRRATRTPQTSQNKLGWSWCMCSFYLFCRRAALDPHHHTKAEQTATNTHVVVAVGFVSVWWCGSRGARPAPPNQSKANEDGVGACANFILCRRAALDPHHHTKAKQTTTKTHIVVVVGFVSVWWCGPRGARPAPPPQTKAKTK